MTTFVLTERTKNALLDGWPADLGKNPFRDGFLYFDSLRIENANDHIGGARIVYCFGGHDIAWHRVEGVQIADHAKLDLYGFEGRTTFIVKDDATGRPW